MCDSIANGGPTFVFPAQASCPPANVTIASNVLATNGNVICANIISGDGTFTGNLYVSGIIYGSLTFSTLNVSQVINASSVIAKQFIGSGNTISNLNASNLAFGIVPSSLIYGNTISNINGANVSTVLAAQVVTANAQSNITSLGTLTGLNVQGLLIASNGSAISNINASNIAFGNIQGYYVFGNTISNIQSLNIVQPFANLYVSNTVTTTNIVAAGFTSNATNTNFNFDTLTIPFIYSTTMNVATTLIVSGTANVVTLNVSNAGTFSNLTASLINATTINVTSIFGKSGFVGIGTTNPTATLHVTGNIYASNALSTTNVFASNILQVGSGTIGSNVALFSNIGGGSNVVVINSNAWVGIGTGNPQTPLHVSTSSGLDTVRFYDSSGIFGMTITPKNGFAGGVVPFSQIGDLVIANPGGPISMGPQNYSSTAGLGLGIRISSNFLTGNVTLFANTQFFTVTNSGIGVGIATPSANLHVTGNVFASNALTTRNVFASNILQVGSGTIGSNVALFSNIGGGSNVVVINSNAWVGIGTTNPTSTLHVAGNIYASNAITTQNIFASNILQVGSGTIGSNVALFSNISGGSNVVVINSNAWVGIGTTNPTSPLTVTGNASFAADTFTVPFATVGTLQTLSGATIGPVTTTLGSNLLVISNVSGGSNVTVMTGNAMGISNVAPATTLSVGGTISALGNVVTSNYGTCPPLTYRQGAAGTNWTTAGTTNVPVGTGYVNMQCGSNVCTAGTSTVTFPLSYSGQPIVILTAVGTGNSNIWVSTAPTLTNFVVTANTSTQQFSWMSVGI